MADQAGKAPEVSEASESDTLVESSRSGQGVTHRWRRTIASTAALGVACVALLAASRALTGARNARRAERGGPSRLAVLTRKAMSAVALSTADCEELDGLVSCVSTSSSVGDDGLTCTTLLDYGLNLVCNDTYTITDDEVTEIDTFVDSTSECDTVEALVSDCWSTSITCEIYELEIYELADEYLDCDLRRR